MAGPSTAQETSPAITCEAGFAGGASGQVCQVAPLAQDGLTSTLLTDANGAAVQHALSLGGLSNASVLLLFDTSVGSNVGQLGGRETILNSNLASARTLVRALPADAQVGVATFDAGKDLSLGFTTDRAALTTALDPQRIAPTGLNTFLYEAAIDAIRELEKTSTARRALVIFSDGESEDQAFSLTDVVNTANTANVQIIGLGSIRARSELGFTQTLERLGEETGGLFFNSPVGSGAFQPEALAEIVSFFGGGGTLSIPDTALSPATAEPLSLTLQYADGTSVEAAFRLPQGAIPSAQAAPETATESAPVTLAQSTPVTPGTQPVIVPTPTSFQETFLQRVERIIGFPWWWLAAGLGAVVVLLILLLLLRRRGGGRETGPEGPGGQRPVQQQAAPRPPAPAASARAAAQAATAVAPAAAPATEVAASAAPATAVAPPSGAATTVVPEPPAATRRVAAGATKVIDAPASTQTRQIRTTLGTLKKLPSDEMVKLYDQTVSLGRSETCTVSFDDDSVSRNHAEITFGADGSVTITDLQSTNGVFVNDRKVTSSAVTPSDKIRLGKAEFMVLLPLASA